MSVVRKRILHITPTLGDGGAERTLTNLCLHSDKYEHYVMYFKRFDTNNDIKYETLLIERGIILVPIKIYKTFDVVKKLFWIRSKVKNYQPNLVQSWQYYGNFLSIALAGLDIPIVWNLRRSDTTLQTLNRKLWIINKICAFLSFYLPTQILACGQTVKTAHEAIGYDNRKMKIIHNGLSRVDCKYNESKRIAFRRFHNLKDETIIIAMLGRFDVAKNYDYALDVLQKLIEYYPNICLFLAGKDMNSQNTSLISEIIRLGLRSNIKLLGSITEIDKYFSGADIYLSTSITEGFSNSLIESMSCSLQCFVTDVGSNAEVLGSNDFIIPLNDANMAAKMIAEHLSKAKDTTKVARPYRNNRLSDWVAKHYTIDHMVKTYEQLWQANLKGQKNDRI